MACIDAVTGNRKYKNNVRRVLRRRYQCYVKLQRCRPIVNRRGVTSNSVIDTKTWVLIPEMPFRMSTYHTRVLHQKAREKV
eukprot:2425426-Pyramimonas_sp.AAC.2